jgi:arylsulfatase A-like enzyme
MPDTKYLNLYEEVEFPYPETFYDDYATRCEAAHKQEMRIEDNMTLVYDLKVDELKETKEFESEWGRKMWNASLDRMTDTQREAWIAAYKPSNEKMIAKKLKGDDLLKWKYQRYLKDYLRCIKTIDDEVGRLLDYLEKKD